MAEFADKPGPRILEDRIAVAVSRNSEGTKMHGYSNWEMGKLIMDLATSNKRKGVICVAADMLQ
jgi:hypothetical protein